MFTISDLSIIIPTFNEEQWIECTLKAVLTSAPDAEIVIQSLSVSSSLSYALE